MYELSDYDGKSTRVRMAMLIDDVEENASDMAKQIVDGFSDAHFCNRTRIELDDLEEAVNERGLTLSDALKSNIQGIYDKHLKWSLKDAGFKDIREVRMQGKCWYEFYKY